MHRIVAALAVLLFACATIGTAIAEGPAEAADARIVADQSLDGRSGESPRKFLKPFFTQSAVFNRAAVMTEEMKAK